MWFKVEGQVVERPTSTFSIGRGVCSQCHISTLQQLTLVGAASTLGHALQVRKQRKMAAHAEACRAVGVVFIPLVVEFVGRWSDEAIHTIASIGRLQGQCLGTPSSEIRHLFQRLAISLWKGITTLWIHRQSSPSCQHGQTDLTDLVIYLFIYLFIYIFVFIIYIFVFVVFMFCIITEHWEH